MSTRSAVYLPWTGCLWDRSSLPEQRGTTSTDPSMDGPSRPTSRSALKLRWRNALALVAAGGLFLFIGVLAETFIVPGSNGTTGAAALGPRLIFLGVTDYLMWTVKQGEARLRRAGLPWQVDRTFLVLPIER